MFGQLSTVIHSRIGTDFLEHFLRLFLNEINTQMSKCFD